MIPACFINSVNTVQIAIITRRLEFRRLSLLDITITLVGTVVSIALAVDRPKREGDGARCGRGKHRRLHPRLLLGPAPDPELPPSLGARPPAVRDSRRVRDREHGGFPKLRLRDRRRTPGCPSGWLLLPRVHAGCRVSEEGEPGDVHAWLPGLVTSHERRRGSPPSSADGSHDHADSLPSPDNTGDCRAQVRHVVLRTRMAGIDRSRTDIDDRRCGHACRGGGHGRDARDRPSSSRDVVGMGPFPRLRRCRFRRGPLRSTRRRGWPQW